MSLFGNDKDELTGQEQLEETQVVGPENEGDGLSAMQSQTGDDLQSGQNDGPEQDPPVENIRLEPLMINDKRDKNGNLVMPIIKLAPSKNPPTYLEEDVEGSGIVNIGMEKPIQLPSVEQQRAGFQVEGWVALITQYPDIYKREKSLRKQNTEEGQG